MLLDIQQGLFQEDDELLALTSENPHQQALRALFAGNHSLFLGIISKHNMGRFHLSPFKVLADCLNRREAELKLKYTKLFNSKFSEVIRDSEVEGRFFAKPEQLSLHNYAKSLYFEDRGKLKADESIAEVYANIFKRISNIEDFVYFINLAVTSAVREPFQFVEDWAHRFLTNPTQLSKDLQIFKYMEGGGQQEKLIIEYSFCVVASTSLKNDDLPEIARITAKVHSSLKNQPYRQLLDACLELSPQSTIPDVLHKHPRELIQYDFKNNECLLNSQQLHPDLRGSATFKTYFKKMKLLEQLVQKFEVIAHSAKIQEGKLLLGINYELLGDEDLNTEAKHHNKKVTTKYISQYSDFLNLLAHNISSEFVVIGEQNLNDQYYNIKYACKCFNIFGTMNKLRTVKENNIYDHVLITWGRLFCKWTEIKDVANETYFSKAIESYFSLIYSIQKWQEFQPLSNFQSEASKIIYELLIRVDKYPLELTCFRGIKNAIFRWSVQNLPQTEQMKKVLNKFIGCFFDDKLIINSIYKEDLFETPTVCKSVKKTISTQIIKSIALKIQRLDSQKINVSWNPNAYQYNQFFVKLGCIISSRILDSVQIFITQIVKLYHNYAHVWPILHSYRLWVLQICKDHTEFKYEQKLQHIIQLWDKLSKNLLAQLQQKKVISSNSLNKATLQLYEQFYVSANVFINSLFLKKIKDPISKQVFSKYVKFLFDYSQKLQDIFIIGQDKDEKSEISQWASQGFIIQKGLFQIQQQLLVNIRFWICNSLRFLTISEEESIVKYIGQQIHLTVINNKQTTSPWRLICTAAGMTELRSNSVLNTRQIIGPLQRYTAKMNARFQNFIPFNFFSALYASIRSKYEVILKYILTNLLKDEEKWLDLWLVLDKILFTPVLVSGSCIFNGQTHEKAKEDMALGIYYDQFEKLTSLLTEGDMSENVKIIVMLEEKKFFSKFYEILKTKNVKIVEKISKPNPIQMRYNRGRNMSPEEVINALGQMGVSRQQAEIALENIQVPDHNLAMQWIDNNQQRIEQLILNRTLERTRQQARRQPRRQVEAPANQILTLSYQRFYEKEKMIKQSRTWIKIVFKELFKDQNMDLSETLKDLLFMFMDSLKQEQQQSQYANLNEKLFLEIDQLNKQQQISNRLLLYLIILQGSFSKTEKTKNDFFQRSINTKILSYLPRIENPAIIEKIFSLINATLPVFTTNDVITPQLQNYLSYLLDLILKYRRNKKTFSDIMLKIAKSGKQTLMQRITRNLKVFFRQNLIKQNIFSLINILFDSDKELTRVNAELDLKTYLYERYRHRINNFHPDKEHVLEIDIKEYQTSFPKYEKGSAIYEVTIGMLSKKKNKNRYFYYDCRKQKNAFDYSHYGKCSFLKYPIKQHFKTVIRSLLTSLYEAKDAVLQEDILTDLYKLLSNYKILLPFTIHQEILGNNLIDWMLFSQCSAKRKFKFLTLLTLNANFFIHLEGYSFSALSDYVIARIITSLLQSNRQNALWTSFGALYLSQVRRFSELSQANLSKEVEINLIQHYQRQLENCSPLEYVTISQFLYIQYKRRMVDNLRRKYKFVVSQIENTFDRQFLNISPFFNSVAVKKEGVQKVEPEVAENIGSVDEDDDEESPEMILEEELDHRFLRRRQNLVSQESQFQQLIIPLPQQPPKQNKQKEEQKIQIQKELEPIVIKSWQCLSDIIARFQKYLHFEEQIAIDIQLKEAVAPQQPIIFSNLANGFKLNVEQLNLDLDLRVKKLSGFQNRISQIYAVFVHKNTWDCKKKDQSEDRMAFLSLGRRLMESLQHQGEGLAQNRQALLTLQRLMQGRYNREAAENPPSRTLNINDIYQHLQQFAEPIVPVVQPPPAQQLKIQQPVQQQVQQPVQAPKPQPMIAQSLPNNLAQVNSNVNPIEAENVPKNQSEEHLQQLYVPQDFEFEEIIPGVNQPSVQQQNVVVDPIIPEVPPEQAENRQNNFISFGELELSVNNPPQEQLIEIPQPNIQAIPQEPQQPQQPPPRQREILSMMGLPQTFLRDVGLDEEFFDSLPEDLQQEQLLQFMSQQGATINRRNSNPNNNNPNQGPPDQTSENIAFLQSLDMQTRAQVLIEATPEFLATLPPNIREEAERYRHHQLNRIIEEEEIEEERNHSQKNKAPLVYPVVKKEEFSPITDEAARAIFLGVFNIYPKLKLSALKILLQNKTTQEKTLATIIAILNYLQCGQKQVKLAKITKVQWVGKQQKISIPNSWSNEDLTQVRTYLLHIILENMNIPLYKDEEFLMQPIRNQVYCQEFSPFLISEQIDPLIQLSGYALNYYPQLATELLKKAKTLPDKLFQKLVEGIRKQAWPLELYDSLQNFSNNQTLKTIFAKQFDQKAPTNKILSKLLKYKFAQLISLKKIHQDALEYYNMTSIEFLNQIFCIYTLQTLSEIQPLLNKHKQIHFEVIKYLIQNGREIQKEPIGIILKRPQLIDFQTKKFIFRNHPKLRKSNGRRVHIEVDRTHLFQGSYNQLMSRTVRQLQGKIQVSFINEPGYDAGGLKREWFLLVSREIFNQNYALFEKSSSGSTYQPNPKSYINPDHLNYFKFIGRFIAKALVQRELIDAYFTRAFYKVIIGQELQFNDLEAQDYEFYKSMQWLKNNKIDEGIFTFSYIYDNFGNKIEKELLQGGKDIIVTEINKKEYIEKYSMAKMRDDFSSQLNKFLEGFYEVIPQECIAYFEAKELQLLISGVPEVDIEDMKKNTDYSGYNPADQIIVWFWQIVAEYSQQDVAKLVQFITGTSKIPVEGFSHLIGMNGIQRISIHRDPCEHQLPKSHTCFNQLDLPNYPTKEILRQKLGICLAWGSEGFGFM